jgi:hypothetical protein
VRRSTTPRREATPPAGGEDRRILALGAALVAAVLLTQLWLVRDLRTLPSPIFGGDYSYQMGCIESIRASGDPMASCSVSGALPGYLPLYGTVVALFSRASGWAVVPSMLALSVVFRALSTAIAWWVFTRLHGRSAGFALACLWSLLLREPILKYTEFTLAILVPLYYYALCRFAAKPAFRTALPLGLTLAAAGYSHAVVFIGGIVIATGTTAIAALAPGERSRLARLAAAARGLLGVAALSLLALGYWYRPLFVAHGAASAHYTEWNGGVSQATFAQRLAYARGALLSMVRVDEWPAAALNLLVLAGLVALWRTGERRRFLPGAWAAAATFLWMLHPFVTMPLLHTHFVPDYVRRYLWAFAAFLVAAIPVALLFGRLRRGPAFGLAATLLAVTLAGLAIEARSLAADSAMAGARQPADPALASLQAWVLAHTRPDDVALSNNELSFAWSALTGRKAVVARRAQNDPFADMDVRNRDAALMLYGRDEEARRRLLRQYGVRYLFWMEPWIDLEYRREAQGLAYMDPLLYFRNPAYDDELTRAGVETFNFYGWVDPTLRGPEYPRFELTLVGPGNYRSPERPWREGLDSHLEKVWRYEVEGREVAALYAVRP